MKLYPAIDLRGGQAVRLYQGDYDQMTVYNADPAAQAREFIAAGAKYLHVVDLDGAKDDTTANMTTIAAIAKQGGLFIEVGGGIRDEARIEHDYGIDARPDRPRKPHRSFPHDRSHYFHRYAGQHGQRKKIGFVRQSHETKRV